MYIHVHLNPVKLPQGSREHGSLIKTESTFDLCPENNEQSKLETQAFLNWPSAASWPIFFNWSIVALQCWCSFLLYSKVNPLCIYICSLWLYLYFCFANRVVCTIFLDSIYVLIYNICCSVWPVLNFATRQMLAPCLSQQSGCSQRFSIHLCIDLRKVWLQRFICWRWGTEMNPQYHKIQWRWPWVLPSMQGCLSLSSKVTLGFFERHRASGSRTLTSIYRRDFA